MSKGFAMDQNGFADELAARIKAGKVKDGFTAQDVVRHGWRGMSNPGSASQILRVLVTRGTLAVRSEGATRYKTPAYRIVQ